MSGPSEDVKRIELASALRSMLRQLNMQLVDLSDAVLRVRNLSYYISDLKEVQKELQGIKWKVEGINNRLDAIVDLATECKDAGTVAKEVESLRKYLGSTLTSDQLDKVLSGYEKTRPEKIDMSIRYFAEVADKVMRELEENRRQLVALAESLGMGDAAARAEEDARGWAETILDLTRRLMESLGIKEEAKPS